MAAGEVNLSAAGKAMRTADGKVKRCGCCGSSGACCGTSPHGYSYRCGFNNASPHLVEYEVTLTVNSTLTGTLRTASYNASGAAGPFGVSGQCHRDGTWIVYTGPTTQGITLRLHWGMQEDTPAGQVLGYTGATFTKRRAGWWFSAVDVASGYGLFECANNNYCDPVVAGQPNGLANNSATINTLSPSFSGMVGSCPNGLQVSGTLRGNLTIDPTKYFEMVITRLKVRLPWVTGCPSPSPCGGDEEEGDEGGGDSMMRESGLVVPDRRIVSPGCTDCGDPRLRRIR